MNKQIRCIILVLLFLPFGSKAQERIRTIFYSEQAYLFNPAKTGDVDGITALFQHRNHLSVAGAPVINTVGIHSPFAGKMGLGILVRTENQGNFSDLSSSLNYAYKLRLDDKKSFRFGIKLGMLQRQLRGDVTDEASLNGVIDPTKAQFDRSSYFNAGVGAVYKMDKLEVGVSFPELISDNENSLQKNIWVNASYTLEEVIDNLDIIPYVYYTHPNFAGVNIKAVYKKVAWVRIGGNSSVAIDFAAGYQVEGLKVMYAYQMHTGAIKELGGNSHELGLSFELFHRKLKKPKFKKVF